MPIILDIAAVALFLFYVWRGRTRGFIKTVASLLALIFAFIGAGFLSDLTTPAVSESIVYPQVEEFMSERVSEESPETPAEFKKLIMELGVPADSSGKLVSSKPMSKLVENTSAYMAETVTHALLSIIYFTILYMLFNFLFGLLDKVFKLPVLNMANKILGLVCGAIFGILFICFLTTMLRNSGLLNSDIINETRILSALLALKLI